MKSRFVVGLFLGMVIGFAAALTFTQVILAYMLSEHVHAAAEQLRLGK